MQEWKSLTLEMLKDSEFNLSSYIPAMQSYKEQNKSTLQEARRVVSAYIEGYVQRGGA